MIFFAPILEGPNAENIIVMFKSRVDGSLSPNLKTCDEFWWTSDETDVFWQYWKAVDCIAYIKEVVEDIGNDEDSLRT